MTTASPTPLVRSLVGAGLFAIGLLTSAAANANITFNFEYSANATDAFNVTSFGAAAQARRDALTSAGQLFSNMFATHFSNSGSITLSVTGYNDLAVNTLASAGSQGWYWPSDPAGFNAHKTVTDILQGRGDAFPGSPDGTVKVNFGYSWQLNPTTTPSNSQFDFYSTMFHEFTHAVGFAKGINLDGSGSGGSHYTEFDRHIVDKNGVHVVNLATGLINQSVWDAAKVGGTNAGLFWDGAYGVAANGGSLVPLYSPTVWAAGSTGSHVDELAPFSSMLMSYSTGTGAGVRDYSAVEIGMLRDIGYTAAAVPEPETYAMMFAGLGVLGTLRRRQKRA